MRDIGFLGGFGLLRNNFQQTDNMKLTSSRKCILNYMYDLGWDFLAEGSVFSSVRYHLLI